MRGCTRYTRESRDWPVPHYSRRWHAFGGISIRILWRILERHSVEYVTFQCVTYYCAVSEITYSFQWPNHLKVCYYHTVCEYNTNTRNIDAFSLLKADDNIRRKEEAASIVQMCGLLLNASRACPCQSDVAAIWKRLTVQWRSVSVKHLPIPLTAYV
jgi:hypothetical protein